MKPVEGATTCEHYVGVKFTKSRKCCGGRTIFRTRISCKKRNIVYSDKDCIAAICPLYKEISK
jgi:hypothetical protein